MHHKNIKVTVKRRLKKDHPDWRRLTKKGKKALAEQVTDLCRYPAENRFF